MPAATPPSAARIFPNDTLSYNLGINQRVSDDERLLGGSVAARYNAANAILHGSYNKDQNTRQTDYGVEGAIVATRDTLMFTQPLGETDIIVATPGAGDVGVLTKSGVKNQQQRLHDYFFCPALPQKQGSARYRLVIGQHRRRATRADDPQWWRLLLANFETRNGRRLLISLSSKDGKPAPFAAEAQVYGLEEHLLSNAMVADKGQGISEPAYPKSRG